MSDVILARRVAKAMSKTIGFDEVASEEIVLAVSELASNLVKHAINGRLTLEVISDGERRGIQIKSEDSGPGIEDVEQVLKDGFSSTDSLGFGLGAVNRIMDEFEIESLGSTGGGTRVVAKMWVYRDTVGSMPGTLEFGAASRPHPESILNGDAFVIKRWGEITLVGVIDGLGHGQYAHRAAQEARNYVEKHFKLPLKKIFLGTNRACRGTRGVVMALVKFDEAQEKMWFASIGNISGRVFGTPEPMNFIIRRGFIGVNAPSPVVLERHWDPRYVMVLHSDGLLTKWQWKDFSHLAEKSATVIAQQLLNALGRDTDDATVVVVKSARQE